MAERSHGFATRAIHAGQSPDPMSGAVMTPVYLSSTFAQESPGKTKLGYEYSRSGNPTRDALEDNLASLEQGRKGLCFASGSAAQAACVHTLSSGDHVLLSDDVYGGTFRQFDKIFKQLGIAFTVVDMTNRAQVTDAVTDRTRMVWLESPSNPMLKVIDIPDMAKLAHDNHARLVVDNTFASPVLTNPLTLGADIVLHSSTKYIGGHSDIVGGALVVGDADLADRLRFIQNAVGAVPGIMDCFLLLRSTKTLQLRIQRACENARKIATWLSEQPQIEQVIYPGLPSHPQHELAARQMKDFGAMISMHMKGGIAEARAFLERLKVFFCAESLGGVESLVEHPAIMTHASVPPEQRQALGITDGFVRLSIGVEDVEDLIADLDHALN